MGVDLSLFLPLQLLWRDEVLIGFSVEVLKFTWPLLLPFKPTYTPRTPMKEEETVNFSGIWSGLPWDIPAKTENFTCLLARVLQGDSFIF